MPVFDQPDIKAPWVLKAAVEKGWTVVANDSIDKEHDTKEGHSQISDCLKKVSTFFGVESDWDAWVATTDP